MAKIRTTDDLFGDGKTIYDEYGNKIGTQSKDLFGDGVSTYDKYGNKVATTYQNVFGDGTSTYDKYGNKIASTYQNVFGEGTSTYDKYGNKVAETYQDVWDPSSSTTYTTGNAGSLYDAGGISYGDLYGSSYGGYSGGYTGPYYGYSDSRSPREKKKDKVCYWMEIVSIVALVLDGIWCLVGLFIPDKVHLDLNIYFAVYAAGILLLSFFSGLEEGALWGETIAWEIGGSLVFLFLYGQATYNANGYNSVSASITYKALGRMAIAGAAGIAGGWAAGLFAERVFSGRGNDGRTGTIVKTLLAAAAAYGVLTVFRPVYRIPLIAYKVLCCVLIFSLLFLIIRKHGKRGAFRAVMMTLVFTAGFTALFHNLDYGRVPLRSLYRLMTTIRSVRYYLILLGTAAAAMIAGALVRNRKR